MPTRCGGIHTCALRKHSAKNRYTRAASILPTHKFPSTFSVSQVRAIARSIPNHQGLLSFRCKSLETGRRCALYIFSLLPLMEERQWTDMNTTRSKSRGGSARSGAAPLCNRRLYVARRPLSGVLIIACLRACVLRGMTENASPGRTWSRAETLV